MVNNEYQMTRRELKSRLWDIIRAEGVEVTNQNIDWLLERAWKSAEATDVPYAETREKQIEEMATLVIRGCNEGGCEECEYSEVLLYPDCVPLFTAKALYNAGYRKATEVAPEIFAEIDKLAYRFMNDEHYIFGDMVWDIAELKKEVHGGRGMNKYSDKYLNRIVECPCCKRKVRQGHMMCGLPMCAECFYTKESEGER